MFHPAYSSYPATWDEMPLEPQNSLKNVYFTTS